MEFYSNIIHFGAVSYARDKDTSKSLLHPALALLPFVFRRKGNGIAKYISSLCPIKTCLFLNFYIQTKPLKSVLYSHQQKKKKKPHQRFFKHSPKPVHTHCQGPAHYFRGPNPPARWGARKRSRRTATTTLAWPPTCHPHRRASRRPVQRSRAESRQTHPHRRRSLIGSSHTHEPSLRAARCIYPRAQARVRAGRLHHFSQLDPRTPPPGEEKHGEGAVLREGGVEEGEVDEGGGREAGEVHTGERGRRVEVDAQECRPAALRQELQASVDQLPPGRPQEGEHLAPGGGHHPQPPRHTRQQVVPSYFAPPLLQSAWFIYLYTHDRFGISPFCFDTNHTKLRFEKELGNEAPES